MPPISKHLYQNKIKDTHHKLHTPLIDYEIIPQNDKKYFSNFRSSLKFYENIDQSIMQHGIYHNMKISSLILLQLNEFFNDKRCSKI